MPRILVTGANGFVGQHLVKELAENGHEVIGIGGAQGVAEQSPYISDYKVVDLTNRDEVREISFEGLDGMIHLAGLAAVGPSFDDPMLYFNVNVGIEVNLFEAALQQDVKPRFLIISSGTLYDPKADQPLTEMSPVVPSSPYAVSKIGQEQMAWYYQSRGFECIIARPLNHIGQGQGLGFLIPDIAKQIVDVEKGQAQEVLVGNLDAKRDYTDVRDIVRAYRLLLDKGRPGETYNVCSGKALSGHEILAGLQKVSSSQAPIKQDESRMRPSDTPVLSGSHDKLTRDTGWQPEIDLETTLRDVVEDWRSKD